MNQETIDEGAMLALNNEHREETSELDGARLHALIVQGFPRGPAQRGRDAFLIAFDQDAISASRISSGSSPATSASSMSIA